MENFKRGPPIKQPPPPPPGGRQPLTTSCRRRLLMTSPHNPFSQTGILELTPLVFARPN